MVGLFWFVFCSLVICCGDLILRFCWIWFFVFLRGCCVCELSCCVVLCDFCVWCFCLILVV